MASGVAAGIRGGSVVHARNIITPHAQRERGKVIGRGVHIYIYLLHTSPAHCTFFNDA